MSACAGRARSGSPRGSSRSPSPCCPRRSAISASTPTPRRSTIEIGQEGDALTLEVANDGAPPAAPGAGLGLRLASMEALRHEGVVEFGPIGDERWRVRLVCPLSEDDGDAG